MGWEQATAGSSWRDYRNFELCCCGSENLDRTQQLTATGGAVTLLAKNIAFEQALSSFHGGCYITAQLIGCVHQHGAGHVRG